MECALPSLRDSIVPSHYKDVEMVDAAKLGRLREVISENLRVQRDNDPVEYISVGTALQDAMSKQNLSLIHI